NTSERPPVCTTEVVAQHHQKSRPASANRQRQTSTSSTMWLPALSKMLPLVCCFLIRTPPTGASGMNSAVIASVKQMWADVRIEVTDGVRAKTASLQSTVLPKDREIATSSSSTTPAAIAGWRFPIIAVGVFFGCIAVACIIRLLGKFTLRMARSGAATAHEYLHRVISGIVASTQRRPLARLWRAVSELGLRLGHVQELQRLAMNARVDMCGETRRLEGTAERLTASVSNLRAAYQAGLGTRRLEEMAERLTASVSNLRAAYQAGLGLFNDANALLNQLVVQFNHSSIHVRTTQTTPATGKRPRVSPEQCFHPTEYSGVGLHYDGLEHERRGRENCKQSKKRQGGT
ncbi:unnamed protein product, partial [Ectocarpus fasciculatus]